MTMTDIDRALIRSACSELVADYAYLVDSRQFDAIAHLFAEDGVLERPDSVVTGRAAIAENWNARPTSFVTCHVCTPPSFREITETEALSHTYFTLYHVTHDGAPPAPLPEPAAIGAFHDRFVKTAEGWRFTHRRAVGHMQRH